MSSRNRGPSKKGSETSVEPFGSPDPQRLNIAAAMSNNDIFQQNQRLNNPDFIRKQLDEHFAQKKRGEAEELKSRQLSAATTPVASSSVPTNFENSTQIKEDIDGVKSKAEILIDKLTEAKEQLSKLIAENDANIAKNTELDSSTKALESKVLELDTRRQEVEIQLGSAKAELEKSMALAATTSMKTSEFEDLVKRYEDELISILQKSTDLRFLFETEKVSKLLSGGGRSYRRSQRRNRRQTKQSHKRQIKSLRHKH
jgi:hypothetical protein